MSDEESGPGTPARLRTTLFQAGFRVRDSTRAHPSPGASSSSSSSTRIHPSPMSAAPSRVASSIALATLRPSGAARVNADASSLIRGVGIIGGKTGNIARRSSVVRRGRRGARPGAFSASTGSDRPASASSEGMYEGTVLFHLYPELKSPKPIFNTFLEGALHCCEVAKSHPSYATAHFHEAYDQEDAVACKPHGYFNMALFSCAPEALWDEFEDLKECLDIGHMDQVHHPLPCRETACIPGPGPSAIAQAPHGTVRYAETDAVVLVAAPRGHGLDPDEWVTWSGAGHAQGLVGDGFLGASLHECAEASSAFSHVVRVEMGAADDEAVAAAVAAAKAGAGEGAVVGAYRCAFNVEKTGTPAGALPAVREIQKRKAEGAESEGEARARLEKDGSKGGVV